MGWIQTIQHPVVIFLNRMYNFLHIEAPFELSKNRMVDGSGLVYGDYPWYQSFCIFRIRTL